MPRTRLLLAALLLVSVAAGCATRDGDTVVSTASSLTEVVADLAAARPDLGIVANVGGSQALAGQLLDGAPADVFLSADPDRMAAVADAGLLRSPAVVVAGNALAIVVADGNPAGVEGVADLARQDLVVVLAAPAVPVGAYTQQALGAAGIDVAPASEELSVRALVGRIASGDADVGVAYVTDAAAVAGVEAIRLPDALQPEITYVAGALTADGEAVVAALTGPEGRELLGARGFLLP